MAAYTPPQQPTRILTEGLGHTLQTDHSAAAAVLGGEALEVGEAWTRPYNPTVVNVLASHEGTPGSHLFGIVGDLDNLGYHVAFEGRANAENLVDFYNQAIRGAVNRWSTDNADCLVDLTFVPSGEEVLILGATTDPDRAESFMAGLRQEVMGFMNSQQILDIGNTAASFGGMVFGQEYDGQIAELTAGLREGASDEVVARGYFKLLGTLRERMAERLDEQKFSDVLPEGMSAGVALRRLVWNGMLTYKENTRQIIRRLHERLTDGDPSDVAIVAGLLALMDTWRPGIPQDSRAVIGAHLNALGITEKI